MDTTLYRTDSLADREIKRKVLGNYTRSKRIMDVSSTTIFAVLYILVAYRLVLYTRSWNLWLCLLGFALSMVLADFISGLIHWGADTWGTFETPLFGRTFIRSFREHHVTPTAMTKHDLFETNGDNCLAVLPLLILILSKSVIDPQTLQPYLGSYFFISFFTWLALWLALTNQFHSWCHMKHPPMIARWLQKMRIILSPTVHRLHHQLPFSCNYCITNGWCEPILQQVSFWRTAESFITRYTGLVPRDDDMKWTGLTDVSPESIQHLQKKKTLNHGVVHKA